MAQLHTLLLCVLIGFCAVDLCHDSLVFFDRSRATVGRVYAHYNRTRDTPIKHVATVLLALLAISLLRAVLVRRAKKDVFSLLSLVVLAPYFVLIMEPAEDACVLKPLPVNDVELAHFAQQLALVGYGHIATIVIGTIFALWDVDFSLTSKSSSSQKTTSKKH